MNLLALSIFFVMIPVRQNNWSIQHCALQWATQRRHGQSCDPWWYSKTCSSWSPKSSSVKVAVLHAAPRETGWSLLSTLPGGKEMSSSWIWHKAHHRVSKSRYQRPMGSRIRYHGCTHDCVVQKSCSCPGCSLLALLVVMCNYSWCLEKHQK